MGVRRRKFLTGITALGISIPVISMSSTTSENSFNYDTDVVAHRGCSSKLQDNSLQSIQCAISSGADGMELDVRKTKDNYLVLSHDNLRYTNSKISLISTTKLRRLQESHKVIKLEKAFELISDKDIKLYVGLKVPEALPEILQKAREYNVVDKIGFQGWSVDYFKPIQNEDIETVLAGTFPSERYIKKAVESNIDCVMPHYTSQNLTYYHEYAREKGLESGCWAINETDEDIKLALQTQPDFILTNKPITALKYLDRYDNR